MNEKMEEELKQALKAHADLVHDQDDKFTVVQR
jgi:hypothetical protein